MAENNQEQKNEEQDYTPSQKQGIFQSIQNYFNQIGFIDDVSEFHGDVLEPDKSSGADLFTSANLNTVPTYDGMWRDRDDMAEEDDKTGPYSKDNRYRDYKLMINEPELEAGLHVYVDEATQEDAEGRVVHIVSNNSKIKDMLERLFYNILEINVDSWDTIFEMLWMGDAYKEVYLDKETQKEILKLERIKPNYVEREEKDGKLEKFVVNGKDVEPWRIVHFRNKSIRFGNYGASIFESGRSVWRQLKLLEDSVIVYRVTRAPERRIFYVDVGNLSPTEADQTIERFKSRMTKKKMINITTGVVDTTSNVLSYNESFYIPRVQNRANSDMTTLPGVPSPGDIDDLAYFRDKLMALLRVPRDYVSGNSLPGAKVYESGKYLSEQDIKFARIIGRVQQNYTRGLKKIAVIYLLLNGVGLEEMDQFDIQMTKSSAIEEMRRIEVQNQVFSLVSMVQSTNLFPDVWIYDSIFKLDDDEIAEIMHLRKLQAAMGIGQEGEGGGGGGFMGGGDMFGAEGGGEGGIPNEVDAALGGAPGTGLAGGGEGAPEEGGGGGEAASAGAEQQINTMINAMENEIASAIPGYYEDDEDDEDEFDDEMFNSAYNDGVQSDHKERNKEIKRRMKLRNAKRRIKSKVARLKTQLREGVDVNMMRQLNEIQADTDGAVKLTNLPEVLRFIANRNSIVTDIDSLPAPQKTTRRLHEIKRNENSLTNKKWYQVMTNESYDPSNINVSKDNRQGAKSILASIERLTGGLTERAFKSSTNNSLKDLLMEGELKTLPRFNPTKGHINMVQILKERYNDYHKAVLNESVDSKNLEYMSKQIEAQLPRIRKKRAKKGQ